MALNPHPLAGNFSARKGLAAVRQQEAHAARIVIEHVETVDWNGQAEPPTYDQFFYSLVDRSNSRSIWRRIVLKALDRTHFKHPTSHALPASVISNGEATAKTESTMTAETSTELEPVNDVNDADLAALAAAGQELAGPNYFHTPAKYTKGKWSKLVIEDGNKISVPIGSTQPYPIDPLSHMEEWVLWHDKKPVKRIGPGRRVDGFILPVRERLGYLDQTQWPFRNGKHEDPWQEAHYLTLKDTTTGELLTWVSNSFGGRKCIGGLLKQFAANAKKHPGKYPVVLLSSRTDPHPDYGHVEKPVLTIVDWQPFGEGAAPGGSPLLQPKVTPLITTEQRRYRHRRKISKVNSAMRTISLNRRSTPLVTTSKTRCLSDKTIKARETVNTWRFLSSPLRAYYDSKNCRCT
jgi:hypothetical protein